MSTTWLTKYLHQNRLLLVFCKNKDDDTHLWQKKELDQYTSELDARKVKVFYLFTEQPNAHGEPTAEEAAQLQKDLNIKPGTFTVVLLDTDGEEKLRDNRPIAAQALLSIIDVMPSRKNEMGE